MKYLIPVDFWLSVAKKMMIQDGWMASITLNRDIHYLEDKLPANANSSIHVHVFPTIEKLKDVSVIAHKENMTYLLAYVDMKKCLFHHRLLKVEEGKQIWITDTVKTVDLSKLLDPMEILKCNSKNNLHLIKYRNAPKIALDLIDQTKCLIIGIGTLGGNTARNALMWGIENLTFLDYSHVSHSNLLRQSLFEYSNLGQPKAIAAAERIALIYPPAKEKVKGFEFSIPMPGHPFDKTKLPIAVDFLEKQIEQHDVIFVCTDSKESRWLPTVLATVKNKPLINLAVGFDSWTVQRQGGLSSSSHHCSDSLPNLSDQLLDKCDLVPKLSDDPIDPGDDNVDIPILDIEEPNGNGIDACDENNVVSCGDQQTKPVIPDEILTADQFGCYFCISVEGVENTIKHRQIDEQCTVTRGGTSFISSAYAVELMISLLNHPLKFQAPAKNNNTEASQMINHYPPQQIRGNVNLLNSKHALVKRNSECCACSRKIVNAYLNDKHGFINDVCNGSSRPLHPSNQLLENGKKIPLI